MSMSGTPVRSRVRRVSRQAAYYEHARSYDRDTGVFQPYRRAVVEALPLQRGQVVLDVGCGTGLCCSLLRDHVGPGGAVIGIEESPEMAAVARERIADGGWANVTVVQAPAEEARLGAAADAALFCAVHDIVQSPAALRNVLAGLRPGAWVAAGGGKWAAPWLVAVNSMIRALHAPYVRDFSGFDRPWRYLERLLQDVQVQETAFGGGYVMTGRTPG
jgi:ubiquinone/menaquinone biosynthesis C-methylase UbiE